MISIVPLYSGKSQLRASSLLRLHFIAQGHFGSDQTHTFKTLIYPIKYTQLNVGVEMTNSVVIA